MATVNGDLDIDGVLTLSSDPTADLEAATKHYVDTHAGGASPSPVLFENIGSGIGLIDSTSTSTDVRIKSLLAGDNLTIDDDDAGTLTISASGGGGSGGGGAFTQTIVPLEPISSFNDSGNIIATWRLDVLQADVQANYYVITLNDTAGTIQGFGQSYTFNFIIHLIDNPTVSGVPLYGTIQTGDWLATLQGEGQGTPGGNNLDVVINVDSGNSSQTAIPMPQSGGQIVPLVAFIGITYFDSFVQNADPIGVFSENNGISIVDFTTSTPSSINLKSFGTGTGIDIEDLGDGKLTFGVAFGANVFSGVTNYTLADSEKSSTIGFSVVTTPVTITLPSNTTLESTEPGWTSDIVAMDTGIISFAVEDNDTMIFYSPTGAATPSIIGKGGTATVRILSQTFNGSTAALDSVWVVTGALV